jgi:hypothetical protein
MNHLLARKKSSSSLRGKQSESHSVTPSSTTPSDQKSREVKSAPYQNPRYTILLATNGSFMDESDLGITDKSKDDYQTLLNTEQTIPKDSLFRDDLFKSTCRKVQDRNETRAGTHRHWRPSRAGIITGVSPWQAPTAIGVPPGQASSPACL